MRFREGDIVRIAKGTRHYGRDEKTNPADQDGKIVQIDSFHGIRVRWIHSEFTNSYEERDLKLRSR